MSISMRNLNKPTQARWAKVGLAIVTAGSTIAGAGSLLGNHTVALAALACTVIGQFIVNALGE